MRFNSYTNETLDFIHIIIGTSLFLQEGRRPSTDSPDEPIEKPIEVRFSSGISVSVNPEEESRAPITETFLPPGKRGGSVWDIGSNQFSG